MGQQLLGVLGVLGEPARGSLQVWFQHCLPAGQTTQLGRGRAEVDPLADRAERNVVADAVDHRTAQVAAGVGGLLAAQYGLGQVDRGEVGQSRNRHLGELLGGAAHIQGRAYTGTGLGQQLQAASRRQGVLPHLWLPHQHKPSRGGLEAGVIVRRIGSTGGHDALVARGALAGCGAGEVPGRRIGGGTPGRRGAGNVFGRRDGRDAGRLGGEAEQPVDLARGGEGLSRWRAGEEDAGEEGLDGDAFHSGGTRHRTAHQRHPSAVGQGHVDGGPLRAGDQLGGLLHEDRPVTGVQLTGQFVHSDAVVKADGGIGAGAQVRLQQSALACGTLLQQSPLDGFGRLAYHGDERRVLGAARIAEAQDAFNVPAERVADGNRTAGAPLGAFGEVLGTVDPDELPLRQCETDAVGGGELLGEHESRDALDRREASGQGRLSETAQKDRPGRIRDGDVHLAAREPGLQPVEHRT